MGDRPHLSNEKELYDYCNIYSQSTESPTTASSPMISIVQNHSIMNWNTNNTIYHDPVVNQHYFDYSPQQPQQNQYAMIHQQSQQQRQLQLQQQQLYQQQLSYRNSTLFMQGSSSSYQDPYHHHSHNNTNYDYVQHHSSSSSHMAVLDTNYHLLHETNSYHNTHQSTHIPNNTEAPLNNTSPQNIPLDINIATTNETVVHSKQHNNNSINSKKKKLKLTTKKSSTIKEKNESLSPKSTPLPSPVLPIAKRKRGGGNSNSNNNSRRSSIVSYSNTSPSGGQKLQKDEGELLLIKVKEEEGVCYGVLKEGDVNQKAVDQLENELGFLRDECATILIMLDSLRNAFMTDIPASKNHNTTRKQDNNNLPLTGTINFMEENSSGTNIFTSTLTKKKDNIIMPHHNNPINDNNTTMAQNPEMEREMRIAYDDLMLQVRQLEKKVERLEKKSRNACITKDREVKKKKEERLSQNYTTTHSNNTSPLSEEEDLVIEGEADFSDPDNSSMTNKRKRKGSVTLPVNMSAATTTTSKVKKKKNLSTTDGNNKKNKDLLL